MSTFSGLFFFNLRIIQGILMTTCWLSGERSLPFGLLCFSSPEPKGELIVYPCSSVRRRCCCHRRRPPFSNVVHYVKISVLIKFSQKTSVFTLIIISSPYSHMFWMCIRIASMRRF